MNEQDLRELRGQRRLVLMAMRRLHSYGDLTPVQQEILNDCLHALAVIDSRLEQATPSEEQEPSHVGSHQS